MTEFRESRRDLLKAAGVLGVGGVLGGCSEGDAFSPNKPAVPGSENWMRGEERFIATSCGQCEAGCGIRVRVVEGRAVKVEGNSDCPINRGGIGPRGLAAPQVLYDPDRIQGPLLLTGPRGSGEWKSIAWEEAIELLGERLLQLREDARPEQLGILCGRERGMMRDFWERFATAYGTPNFFDGGRSDDGAEIRASLAMQGIGEVPARDWENAKVVLSLGSGVLDASCQTLHFARMRGRGNGGNGRTEIIHVGPSYSRTAMNADEWIEARAGTNAAFVLGVAHVLVRDELFDQRFVGEQCSGFESWKDDEGREHLGFRAVLDQFSPVEVAKICDVPIAVIEDVARSMSKNRPCFAISGADDLKASNGVHTAMAVHALNALLGAIDRPGGLLTQLKPPLAEWEEVELDEIAEAGLEREPLFDGDRAKARALGRSLDQLPNCLMAGDPYSLDTLLIDHSNPIYARADAGAWRSALQSIPFAVSFSPFMDETTAEFANLVLPDDSWLERWEDSCSAPNLGRAVFGLRQPVVERLYDTRATGDVLIDVAQAIGEGLDEAFAWKDFKSAFKDKIIGLHKSKSGSIAESKGSKFLKRLYAEGFWVGDDYVHEQWERVFQTESGRFEFFSTALWKELQERAELRGESIEETAMDLAGVGDPDLLCLPFYRELATVGETSRYPLSLQPYKPHTYARGSGANLPWLVELAPWRGRSTWGSEAELHPDTARVFGIRQSDRVVLESSEGSLELSAYLTRGVRRGDVRVALGAGHTAYGRFAEGIGANAMTLLSTDTLDPFGGSSVLQGTRVSIRRLQS